VGRIAGNGNRPDLGSGDGVLVSGGLQDNGGSLTYYRPGRGAEDGLPTSVVTAATLLVDPNKRLQHRSRST